ncbi:MAG: hypothetical protein RL637_810 [Pseudomonadota bacterium]
MTQPIFKPIPVTEIVSLPFKFDETALLNWLNDLSHADAKEACLRILVLSQRLNKTDVIAKNRIIFLNHIREYLKQFFKRLEHNYWDSGFPLSPVEIIYAEIVVWNHLTLAQGFLIAAQESNYKNDCNFALYMALKSMGTAQLHIASVYSSAASGFWHLVYQIYHLAEKQKVLNLALTVNHKNNLTIHQFFTKMLIFHISDMQQFCPKDMRTLFYFLEKVCSYMVIDTELDNCDYTSDQSNLFVLDLKTDHPPFHVSQQQQLTSDVTRYFSPISVVKTMNTIIANNSYWSGTLKSINHSLLKRVINALNFKQKRLYQRKYEGLLSLSVIGLEDILAFLYKVAEKKPVVVTELTTQTTNIREYNTQDLNAEKRREIWGQVSYATKTPNKKVTLKQLQIIDSSANGYGVRWLDTQTKVKINDILGIISEDKKHLEIAIIRRVIIESLNVFRFGIKVIGFESELVYISNTDYHSQGIWAIFIPGIELLEELDMLIYSTGSLKLGDFFYIHRGEEIKLCLFEQELMVTASISLIQLRYPVESSI